MKSLLTLIISTTAVAFCFIACHKKVTVKQAAASEIIPVRTMVLSKSKTKPTVQVSGQLTTDDETYLSFKTGGIIHSIIVKEGDAVRQGQVLATLDLTEINAQVAQAKLNMEKAKRDFSRISRLYKDSVSTLEQYQNSQTGLAIAQQQLDAASFNLSFSTIRALKDGFVLKKFVSEGQVITSGTSVLLTNGARSGKWIVRCGVSDRDWAAVDLNDRANISIDAFPDQKIEGKLTRKSEGTDPSSGSFTLEVTLDHPSKLLAAGMFSKVSIMTQRFTDAWTIPYDALLDGNAEQGYVFVTDDNKTAKKVNVTLGKITKDRIEVIGGLENSKALIISGSAYLTDSSAIHVLN